MSYLTQLSLKKASVTLLIAIALVAGGIYAMLKINQELTPDIDFPMITVITTQPGAGPQDVANEVSAPLEAAMANVSSLKSLQSVSADNFSIIIAQYDFGHDMKAAEQEISRAVSTARLPADAGAPQVTRINLNQSIPVVQLSLAGNMDAGELQRIAQQEMVPRIKAIPGVQAVDLTGGVTRQVDIVLDPAKMREAKVTTQQIAGVLKANNVSIPSGAIGADGVVLPVRTVSQLASLAEIGGLVVGFQPGTTTPGQAEGQLPQPVLLKDIAKVQVSPSPAGGVYRSNGQPAVGISVTKSQEGNTVRVANAVQAIARDVQAKLGDQVEITTAFDTSTFVTESISGLTREGLIGAIAAVLAIWVFLLSLRSALVTAVSIPLSVMGALVVLYFQGFTLNVLTLGGLTIAIGRVVDDSIVVLENIFRHVQHGDDLNASVLEGTREVATAIFGATMTTIAVFLPLGFIGGIVGVMFRPFALTVTFALLASLVVALTVVPILARVFVGRMQLGRRKEVVQQRTVLQRGYTPVLAWALRHRAWTLVLAAVFFAGSFALIPFIPTTFLPQMGEKSFQVAVSLPPGSGTPRDTLAKAIEAEQVIAGLPGVEGYSTSISLGNEGGMAALGRAFFGQGSQGATISVRLRPDADLNAVQELARQRLSAVEGALTSVGGGGEGDMNSQLQVSLTGDDPEVVRTATLQVLEAVRGVPGVRDVSSAAEASLPEVAVKVDPQKALAVGMTGAQVAQQIRELTAGQTVTDVRLNGERMDVVLRADATLGNVNALRNLPVGVGRTVPLYTIATIEPAQAATQVTRLNQRSSATINGTISAKNTGEVNRQFQQRISELSLPPGVDVEYGGVLQQFREGFNSLFAGIAFAIIIVYIVMVLVMGSLLSPFVIMFSLPLAPIGALAALAVTGRALGLPSLLGLLMLVGIVVTNAIVLIDFVNRLRSRGYSVQEALMEGGRLRLRPVLMTAVTTVLALIPMSLGFTEGAIIASELATVVIGGLLSSTLLTLVVVPVVYSIFEGWRLRLVGETAVAPAGPQAAGAPATGQGS